MVRLLVLLCQCNFLAVVLGIAYQRMTCVRGANEEISNADITGKVVERMLEA